jgi:hypothetical protein
MTDLFPMPPLPSRTRCSFPRQPSRRGRKNDFLTPALGPVLGNRSTKAPQMRQALVLVTFHTLRPTRGTFRNRHFCVRGSRPAGLNLLNARGRLRLRPQQDGWAQVVLQGLRPPAGQHLLRRAPGRALRGSGKRFARQPGRLISRSSRRNTGSEWRRRRRFTPPRFVAMSSCTRSASPM